MVGQQLITQHEVLPFGLEDANTLKVAMSDPMNLSIIDDIEMQSQMEVAPYYATQTSINIKISELYGKQSTMEAAEEFEKEQIKQKENASPKK